MTNLLAGAMLVVLVWAILSIRIYTTETKLAHQRGDELLQKLIFIEGENRVLADQAKYYKAIGEKFLNSPVVAHINEEQLARLAATITQGLGASVCRTGLN